MTPPPPTLPEITDTRSKARPRARRSQRLASASAAMPVLVEQSPVDALIHVAPEAWGAPPASTPPASREAAQSPAPLAPPAIGQPVVTHEQLCQRAYEIWLEKGRPYGQEQANWDQAIAELGG